MISELCRGCIEDIGLFWDYLTYIGFRVTTPIMENQM